MLTFKKIAELPEFKTEIKSFYEISVPWGTVINNRVPGYQGSQVACPIVLDNGLLRVYFSSRNRFKQSFPFYYDVNPAGGFKVINKCEEPLLKLGPAGTYNDSGNMVSQVYRENYHPYGLRMELTGWNSRQGRTRYQLSCGLAHSEDGENWKDYGIYIDRSYRDPCGTSTLFYDISNKMTWYTSWLKWEDTEPFYNIKGFNNDIYDGSRDYRYCLELKEGEGGLAVPRRFDLDGKKYLMYSRRGSGDYRKDSSQAYQVGLAEINPGGVNRIDDQIQVLDDHKLGQMYPYPIWIDKELFILYNMDGFQSPFSVAKLVDVN